MSKFILPFGFALAAAWIGTSAAQAGGWYHMPTSFCQCMGWGFGPGYHAPLMLGPPRGCVPTMPHRVVRLPAAPYGVGVGCDGYDACGLSQLSLPEPSPAEYRYFDTVAPSQPADAAPIIEPSALRVTPPVAPANPLFGPPALPTLDR